MENKKMTKEEFILKCDEDFNDIMKRSKPHLQDQQKKLLTGKMQMITEDALLEGVELTIQEVLDIAKPQVKKEFETYIEMMSEIYSPEWIVQLKADQEERIKTFNKTQEAQLVTPNREMRRKEEAKNNKK